MSKQEKRPDSVHPKSKGFTVSASPLNGVKFELGVILVVALLFWMILERLTDDLLTLVLSLLIYGLVAMGWIVFRSWQVVRQHPDESEQTEEKHR